MQETWPGSTAAYDVLLWARIAGTWKDEACASSLPPQPCLPSSSVQATRKVKSHPIVSFFPVLAEFFNFFF